jgi:hypothetical protein
MGQPSLFLKNSELRKNWASGVPTTTTHNPFERQLTNHRTMVEINDSQPAPRSMIDALSGLQASELLDTYWALPLELTNFQIHEKQGSMVLVLVATNDYNWLHNSGLREFFLVQLTIPLNSESAEDRSTLHISYLDRWSRSYFLWAFGSSRIHKHITP